MTESPAGFIAQRAYSLLLDNENENENENVINGPEN
jgi:hypothetical protein